MSIVTKIVKTGKIVSLGATTVATIIQDNVALEARLYREVNVPTGVHAVKSFIDGATTGAMISLVTRPTDKPFKKLGIIVAGNAFSYGANKLVLSRLSKERQAEYVAMAAENIVKNIDKLYDDASKIAG